MPPGTATNASPCTFIGRLAEVVTHLVPNGAKLVKGNEVQVAGVEAVTGDNALAYLQSLEATVEGVSGALKEWIERDRPAVAEPLGVRQVRPQRTGEVDPAAATEALASLHGGFIGGVEGGRGFVDGLDARWHLVRRRRREQVSAWSSFVALLIRFSWFPRNRSFSGRYGLLAVLLYSSMGPRNACMAN